MSPLPLVPMLLALVLAAPALLTGCYQFNNPVDPGSPSYQGGGPEESFPEDWSYSKPFEVYNGSMDPLTDYAVRVTVHWEDGTDSGEDVYTHENARTDFADIRFSAADGTTLLSCWMQERTAGDRAAFWVRVPSIPSYGTVVLNAHYGNPDASSASSGTDTFSLFDDFSGPGPDTGLWDGDIDAAGKWWVSGGEARCTATNAVLYTREEFTAAQCLSRVRLSSVTTAFIGIRAGGAEPDPVQNRYEVELETENANSVLHQRLRKVGGPIVPLDSDSWSSYDYGFFTAELGGVWDQISAHTESASESSHLGGSDPSCVQGSVCFGTGASVTDFSVDWVAVRPFTLPEPTVGSWGSEETP